MGGQGGHLQALGVGFSGFAYTEIEVLPALDPGVKLTGELAGRAHLLGALRWHLSLSDTKDTAFASVLVEVPDDYPPPAGFRRSARLDRRRGQGSPGASAWPR